MDTEDISLDYLRERKANIDALANEDWQRLFYAAMASLAVVEDDLRLVETQRNEAKTRAERLNQQIEDRGNHNNKLVAQIEALNQQIAEMQGVAAQCEIERCSTTTVDHLRTAQADLAKEIHRPCEVGAAVIDSVLSFWVKAHCYGGPTVLGRGATLVEAMANLRQTWKDLPQTLKEASDGKALDTTLEQIDTVAKQLSNELMHEVAVSYEAKYWRGGNARRSFHASVRSHTTLLANAITAPTLSDLAVAVRKWWAEQQRKGVANA